MRILQRLLLLLALAQLAFPSNETEISGGSPRKLEARRDIRYGIFSVHNDIDCDDESMIQRKPYGGCINIENMERAKAFFFHTTRYYHIIFGMIIEWIKCGVSY